MWHTRGWLLAAGLAAMASAGALAAAEPDAAIKYRQNLMKSQGGHINVVAAVIKGEAGTPDALAPHSRALHLSATTALEAFRQDTADQGMVETTAKDNIWSDWSGFETKMKDLVEATGKLAAAAEAGNAGGEQLQAVGQACKACHDNYRTE